MKNRVHCVILGGGRGTRLQPLTKLRCKPAVPLGGKYRLVDIPISNCINSSLNKIYLLTQFNTASLHRHIRQSFSFDVFGGGFVEILSAEQTELGDNWYQGTADAVRQNLHHINYQEDDLFLILSGDQLYRMDFAPMIEQHMSKNADVTIASKAVVREKMGGLGCLKVNRNLKITQFVEKPRLRKDTEGLLLGKELQKKLKHKNKGADYSLASMGIYLFNAKALENALKGPGSDFGNEIIPWCLKKNKMFSYIFEGYWEDIGTIKAFFEANLMLTSSIPEFNFFDTNNPIYTRSRHLPASKINACKVTASIIAEGSIINEAAITNSVISIRSAIGKKSNLKRVVMMGADYYETLDEIAQNRRKRRPNLGIGAGCKIENAIIDKNARIGDKVVLKPRKNTSSNPIPGVYIKDGVVCVQKGCTIPSGTVI